MGLWEWWDRVNTVVSIPLAVVGFLIAYWQIWKTRSAAVAAKDAAEEATDRFRSLSGASLIPQLVSLEQALDTAIEHRSPDLLRHVVQNWTWQAGVCREYLDGDAAVEKEIQNSISAATSLKTKISGFGATSDWIKDTDRFRKAVGTVTGRLGGLSAKQALNNGSSDV